MSDLEAKLDLARARMDARSFVEYEAKLLRAEVERVRSDAAAVGETYKLMIEERGEQMARIEALEAEVASQRAEGDYLRGIIDELRVEHAKALARIPDPDDLEEAIGSLELEANATHKPHRKASYAEVIARLRATLPTTKEES